MPDPIILAFQALLSSTYYTTQTASCFSFIPHSEANIEYWTMVSLSVPSRAVNLVNITNKQQPTQAKWQNLSPRICIDN